jgi:hypothetical protein
VDPSYSRRLRQMTRSEWELARGRIRLNTPGGRDETRTLSYEYCNPYQYEMSNHGREQE